MDRAAGRRKGLGEVAALTQGNAVLKARTTFRCALRPIQGDPLWRTGLVVAGLSLDRPMSQTVSVLQCLLLSGTNLPDTEDCPRPYPAIARLWTL